MRTFAKYISSALGVKLTRGRIYLARPAVEDNSVADYERMAVVDDRGVEYIFRVRAPGDEPGVGPEFEFMDHVYAVCIKDSAVGLAGFVVTLNGATDDGFYDVGGHGFRKADLFEILDESNMGPGFWVLDRQTKRWEKIVKVEASGWLSMGKEMRSPTDFVFPVAGGGIMAEPLVKCMNSTGDPLLKEGTVYRMATWDRSNGFIGIEINGSVEDFLESRFEMGG